SNPYDFYPGKDIVLPYQRINLKRYPLIAIKTSWGCPYNCTFCDAHPILNKKLRYKNLGGVLKELRLIKRLTRGKKLSIEILDEAFMENRARVIEFCNLLKYNKLNIKWSCFGRVNRIDEKLVKTMARSGCEGIFFGIDAGSNRILKTIKKGFTIEEAIKKVILSKKSIKNIHASFIFRYPFETYGDFMGTLYTMSYLRSKGIHCILHPLAPIKGTKIYARHKEKICFSVNAPCENEDLRNLPGKFITLLKENPEIFYDYYYYDCRDLPRMMKTISNLKA
ncbi:MAG: radical SAM protein, partial [Candidatus Omnitrophica bacterium]|nr:radical SAM protein [Candidatus Omnitrophota bacterium]